MRVFILDSTLNDGARADHVAFGVQDKLAIVRRLDEFGVDYIDAGWPGADARDREFFERARELKLAHAKLAAFGTIRFSRNSVDNDPNLKALFDAGTPAVCLSGESWDLHVYKTLGITGQEHLAALADSIRFLKERGREVIYNVEHFFDAYEANPFFALRCVEVAHGAGADVLCLCDTNGGALTSRVSRACAEVRRRYPHANLGIHAHNDADLAVANSLAAVEQGFCHVQGCFNGYGERCGCANLSSIIPNLELKAGHTAVGRDRLERLSELAHFIAGVANVPVPEAQPYVGSGAFEDPYRDYHTHPEYVGNAPRVTRDIDVPSPQFTPLGYDLTTRNGECSANVTIELNEAVLTGSFHSADPVLALDGALRQALNTEYPAVGASAPADYKIRREAGGIVHVTVEWSNGGEVRASHGEAANMIDAAWAAVVESVQDELRRYHELRKAPSKSPDYSWAV